VNIHHSQGKGRFRAYIHGLSRTLESARLDLVLREAVALHAPLRRLLHSRTGRRTGSVKLAITKGAMRTDTFTYRYAIVPLAPVCGREDCSHHCSSSSHGNLLRCRCAGAWAAVVNSEESHVCQLLAR
jgi:hypothetical protein